LDIPDKTVNYSKLSPSPEDIDSQRKYIFQVLSFVKYKEDIDLKCENIIRRAIKGWNSAPPSFENRIKLLVGTSRIKAFEKQDISICDPFRNIPEKRGKGAGRKSRTLQSILQNETINKINEIDPLDIFSPIFISPEEQLYINRRRDIYNKEFDFNESSDQVLLNQILLDELVIRRINMKRLHDGGKYISEAEIDKIMERFRKNLEKLGVLRVQRLELNTDIQGNIGQLSLELEKKFDKINKIRDPKERNIIINKILDKLSYTTPDEILQYALELEYQRKHNTNIPENKINFDIISEEI